MLFVARAWGSVGVLLTLATAFVTCAQGREFIALLSDYGSDPVAVAEFKGVSLRFQQSEKVHDITHNLPRGDAWAASAILWRSIAHWPGDTVFIVCLTTANSPGEGSPRMLSVRLRSGHIVVGPDNGLFTHVASQIGLSEVREIMPEEAIREGKSTLGAFSHELIPVFVGARLATGRLFFANSGEKRSNEVTIIEHRQAEASEFGVVGNIYRSSRPTGALSTNIPWKMLLPVLPDPDEVAAEPATLRLTLNRDGKVILSTTVEASRDESIVLTAGSVGIQRDSAGYVSIIKAGANLAAEILCDGGENWVVALSLR